MVLFVGWCWLLILCLVGVCISGGVICVVGFCDFVSVIGFCGYYSCLVSVCWLFCLVLFVFYWCFDVL